MLIPEGIMNRSVRYFLAVNILLLLVGCTGSHNPIGTDAKSKADALFKELAESTGSKATTVVVSKDLKDIDITIDMSESYLYGSTSLARLVLDTVDPSDHLVLRLSTGDAPLFTYDTAKLDRNSYLEYLDMSDSINALPPFADAEYKDSMAKKFDMPYEDVLARMYQVEGIIMQQQ
jgi:hypothetical protein